LLVVLMTYVKLSPDVFKEDFNVGLDLTILLFAD
jgi:hypothetical protein